MNAEKKSSYIYVVMAVLLWSPSPAVGKLLLRNLNSLQVLLFTFFVAAASLFIIVLYQKKLTLIKEFQLKDYLTFAYMGFLGVFLYNIFLFTGLMFSSAQEAFIVNYTWPVWVVIFAIILIKEPFSIKKVIAIILGFLGVFVVVTTGNIVSFNHAHYKGDLCAFAGAVSYGLFSVLGKKHNYDKFISMMFYYGFSFIFILIITVSFVHIPAITIFDLLGILWFGIFTSGLAYVFWFLALQYGDTAKMSNIIFLTPFISLLFIYFLIGEKIYYSSILGLIVIVGGIVIQSTSISKRSNYNRLFNDYKKE